MTREREDGALLGSTDPGQTIERRAYREADGYFVVVRWIEEDSGTWRQGETWEISPKIAENLVTFILARPQ